MHYWKNRPIQNTPFYAVIFSSQKSEDLEGFEEMDKLMLELALEQPGLLGYESSGNDQENIFISYWDSMESINTWRNNSEHIIAKKLGKKNWYKRYLSQICKVESSFEFIKPE